MQAGPNASAVGERGKANVKRAAAIERSYGTCRRKSLEREKPHEWDRDEISPAGPWESKASRECETLRTQHNLNVGNIRELSGSWRLGKRSRGRNLKRSHPPRTTNRVSDGNAR